MPSGWTSLAIATDRVFSWAMDGASMRRPLASALLLTAVVFAGCAAEEGSPDPTPSASPTSSATSTTTASAPTNSSATSSTSAAPRPAQTFDVDIQGNSFVGGTRTIQKGDTVRWTQKDSATHTVTSDDGSFDSGNLFAVPTRDQFSHKFDTLGEFPYHCEVHPSMTATITVVAVLPA